MPSLFPTFRTDLEITPQIRKGGGFSYLAKDPRSDEIFGFGEEEYFICQRFDGQIPLSEIQAAFQDRFVIPLQLDQLEAFVRKLNTEDLLVSDTETSDVFRYPSGQLRPRRLCNPDRLLGLLAENFSWCFSRAFLIVSGLVLAIAFGTAMKFGRDFIDELQFVWEQGLPFMLPILGIFVINPLTEIAKGVTCRHYGGYVYEFGVVFLFRIIPRFYCEISDVFWMKSKSDRIRVFSSGLVFQLLMVSIGIIAWKNTTPWSNMHTFWLFFTAASIIFAFFVNLNPLLQRDGYHMLTTWLGIPDLQTRSIALTRSWILRRPLPEPLTFREIRIFKRYGVLWVCFQVVLWSFLLGIAGYLLISSMKGLGAVLFLSILCLRFERFLVGLFSVNLTLGKILTNEEGSLPGIRMLFRLALLAAFIVIIFIPYPFTVGGEFMLLPLEQFGIRARVSSEIKSVLVEEGEWVKKGQTVAVLMGRDQKKKVEKLKAALDEAQARLDLLKEGPKPEEIAKAEQEVKTAAKSLEYSTVEAKRAERMFKKKAMSEKDYKNAFRTRDLDQERLRLAEKNLELVKSGAREESIEGVEAEIRLLKVELGHAQEDLRLTKMISPIYGRIITPYPKEKVGQFLETGEQFAVVEDARHIIAEIEVPEEDISEISVGARVTLRAWAYPNTDLTGKVVTIAPVADEKGKGRIKRTLSEREEMFVGNKYLKKQDKVLRVLSRIPNPDGLLKTDMTGYAKIECTPRPVGVAFTRWAVRFIMVEVWSWIP